MFGIAGIAGELEPTLAVSTVARMINTLASPGSSRSQKWITGRWRPEPVRNFWTRIVERSPDPDSRNLSNGQYMRNRIQSVKKLLVVT